MVSRLALAVLALSVTLPVCTSSILQASLGARLESENSLLQRAWTAVASGLPRVTNNRILLADAAVIPRAPGVCGPVGVEGARSPFGALMVFVRRAPSTRGVAAIGKTTVADSADVSPYCPPCPLLLFSLCRSRSCSNPGLRRKETSTCALAAQM